MTPHRVRVLEFTPEQGFAVAWRDRPVLQATDVRLRVDACGVCGSDRQVVNGESVPPGTGFPLVMGHEIAGTILELGEGVADWEVGHAVVVHPFIACGTCAPCQHGQPNLCVRQQCIGYQAPGGFADEVVVPAAQLSRRPETCPATAAALLVDAYATPYHALKLAGVTAGAVQTVLVIGTGGLGLATLGLARALGILHIGAVTRRSAAIPTIEAHGAQLVVSTEQDARTVARQIRRWSTSSGIDGVIDTVASQDTMALALDVVRPGGTVAMIGMSEEEALLPVAKTVRRGVTVVASYGSTRQDLDEVLALVNAGKLDPTVLVGATLPLERGLEAFHLGRGAGRVVLVPGQSD